MLKALLPSIDWMYLTECYDHIFSVLRDDLICKISAYSVTTSFIHRMISRGSGETLRYFDYLYTLWANIHDVHVPVPLANYDIQTLNCSFHVIGNAEYVLVGCVIRPRLWYPHLPTYISTAQRPVIDGSGEYSNTAVLVAQARYDFIFNTI